MADRPGWAVGTTMLFENENCRVWLLRLEAGQASDWHVHEYPYVYVVTRPGAARTEHVDGRTERDEDHLGFARYLPPDAGHRLVNSGPDCYENVIVELKGGHR